MLNSLTIEDVSGFNSHSLCVRMNEILTYLELELEGAVSIEPFKKPNVCDFYESIHVQGMDEKDKREALFLCYEYLVQMQIVGRQGGFANSMIYNGFYDNKISWRSPLLQIRNASISQAEIILSRVAFEKFMNLIHFLDTRKLLEVNKKKSKLTVLFESIIKSNSKYLYFINLFSRVRDFDTKFRTGEVHKRSGIIRFTLLLKEPTFEEANYSNKLTNILLNCWKPLITILNDKVPTYIHGSNEDFEFLKALLENENIIPDFVRQYRDSLRDA